ncbi:MAG TPA: hydrolase [Desulfobacteraceae bacterium]|nr:C40 family peptidase [Deltaproteobacteria bacterium]MBW2355565.1 C40 family peptidase [Deltaproteobacteria bacterium]RLB97613.1 MAG: hydrolase [Deltaproteobacteria bacterium]HDI59268.1 hydrolase [Desulfobacteraceae bacterium]
MGPAGKRADRRIFPLVPLLLLLAACAGRPPAPTIPPAPPRLATVGIAIQAGAFANLDNAVRLTETLQAKGLEATFFRDDDGLFKVRFGNFASREKARQRALALQRACVLEVFYIVVPEQLAAGQRQLRGDAFVRAQIVRTAKSFLGLPYRWGGASVDDGFDCSGLTMTAYRLNGYLLPRTSRTQFAAGAPIAIDDLRPADLVFFRTAARRSVSHVGLYIGDGRFIHAPGRGKRIRIDSIDGGYYRRRLVGARHFL